MILVSTIALVGFVTVAALLDLRSRRIPNWLTYGFFGVALLLQALSGWGGVVAALSGAGLALALTLPLFVIGALGGGDGKLLMAVGAMLGPERLLVAMLVMALVGGVMALGEVFRNRAGWRTLASMHLMLADRSVAALKTIGTPDSMTIPYGVAIAAGALAGWFV